MTTKAPSSKRVHIATIGAPFGVKGAFRIKTFTDDPKNILLYGSLFDIAGKTYTFHVLRTEPPATLVVREVSIIDRTEAEKLRGTKLYILKENLPSSAHHENASKGHDTDTFYQHELVGMQVVTETGDIIGDVTSVENYGASDILMIKTKEGTKQIPFIKDAVPSIDLTHGTLIIVENFLL
jgi:16S rRNA processing protein RimM